MINQKITVAHLQEMNVGTMGEAIGIEFLSIEENAITARMPVDHRTKQPYGILHGGASVALAETLGSVAAHCSIDSDKYASVGLEINANHLRSVKNGFVIGRASPIHIGRSTHVWEIRITDEKERLVSVSRLTMAIIKKA